MSTTTIDKIRKVLTEEGLQHANALGQTSVTNHLNKAAFLACKNGDVEALKASAGGCFAFFQKNMNVTWLEGGRFNDFTDMESAGDVLLGFSYGSHKFEVPHPAVSRNYQEGTGALGGDEWNTPVEEYAGENPLPVWSGEAFPRTQPTLLKAALDHEWNAEVITALEELGVPESYAPNGFTGSYVVNVKDYEDSESALVLVTLPGEELRVPNAAEMTGAELGEQVRQLKGIKIYIDVKILYADSTPIAPHDIVMTQLALHASP